MASKKQSAAPKRGSSKQQKRTSEQSALDVKLAQPAAPEASPSPQDSSPTPDSSTTPPEPVADTPSSLPPQEPAPASVPDALEILAAAQQPTKESAPVPSGASDASASIIAAAASNAAFYRPESPTRRGGFPKGARRGPDGKMVRDGSASFPASRSAEPTGDSPAQMNVTQLRARVAELEARQSENVRQGLAAGFASLLRVGCSIVAKRKGAHWYVTQDEANEVGEAWAVAAQPYISYVAPALPIIAAAGATYAIIGPRMEADAEIEQGKRTAVFDRQSEGGAVNA